MNIELLNVFGGTIVLGAIAIVSMAVTYVVDVVKSSKNKDIQSMVKYNEGVIEKVKDVVINTTGKYTQTVVEELKKDGKWNKDTAGKVFNNAFNEIQGQLGSDVLDILDDIRGNANVYLTNVIENTLKDNKTHYLSSGVVEIEEVDKAE